MFVRIQGGDGIRIGDDAGAYDCNNWNLITSSAWYNTGAGLYVSSGTTTNANAGTMIGFSARYNTGDGIAFGYAEDNTSHGGDSEGNGGIGFHFMTNSNNITVEGMDSEGNTGGNLQFEAGTSFNTYDGTTSGTGAYVDKATVVSQTGTIEPGIKRLISHTGNGTIERWRAPNLFRLRPECREPNRGRV